MSCVTIQDTKEVQHLTESCYTGNGQTYHTPLSLSVETDTIVKDLIATDIFRIIRVLSHKSTITFQRVQSNKFYPEGKALLLVGDLYTFVDSNIALWATFPLVIGPISITGGTLSTNHSIYAIDFKAKETRLTLRSDVRVVDFSATDSILAPSTLTEPAIDFVTKRTVVKFKDCIFDVPALYSSALIRIKNGYVDLNNITTTVKIPVPIEWMGGGSLHLQLEQMAGSGIQWPTLINANLPSDQSLHLEGIVTSKDPFKLVQYTAGSEPIKDAHIRLALPKGLSCDGRNLLDQAASTDVSFYCGNLRDAWDPEPITPTPAPKDYEEMPSWAIAVMAVMAFIILLTVGFTIFVIAMKKQHDRKRKA